LEKEILDNHKRYVERVELYKSYGYDIEKERNFIIEQAKPFDGRILEAGTGKGYFALALAREGRSFVTFDSSEDEQRFAKLNAAYFGLGDFIEFRIENAEHTSFSNGSFDTIFCVNTVHHLRDPFAVMEEFIRILSLEGRLVLADFNENGFKIIDKIYAQEGNLHEKGKVDLSDIRTYLIQKGFSIKQVESEIQEILIAKKATQLPWNVKVFDSTSIYFTDFLLARFVNFRKKNIESLLLLSAPLLIAYVICKPLFGIGFGILLANYLSRYNLEILGWSLILFSFLITILRAKRLLNPSLPSICILWRFLLWYGIGVGILSVIYLPSAHWQLMGWLFVAASVLLSIPSLHRLLRR
jgi:SAM-dependent methyltransferase